MVYKIENFAWSGDISFVFWLGLVGVGVLAFMLLLWLARDFKR